MTLDNESIADLAKVVKAETSGNLPADALAIFGAEQARLAGLAAPDTAALLGRALPEVDLIAADGTPTSTRQVFAGTTTVLVFYRGAWCPYCNLTLRHYQQHLLPALHEYGVALVAISPQRPDGSLASRQINGLSFPVVSDPGNQIAAALGILIAPSQEALEAQEQLGLDLRSVNADGTAILPMPTVCVIDPASRLCWIDVHPDYTTRTEIPAIIDALDALAGGPA